MRDQFIVRTQCKEILIYLKNDDIKNLIYSLKHKYHSYPATVNKLLVTTLYIYLTKII